SPPFGRNHTELPAQETTELSVGDREFRCEYLQVRVDVVRPILLTRSRGSGAVGAAGIFLPVRVGCRAFSVRRQLIILAEARLNFVYYAKIAEGLGPSSVGALGLAI